MKLLLLSVVLLGAPLQAQAPARTFEVASIKINKSNERARTNIVPGSGRLVITAMTVQEVIQAAYGVQSFELVTIDGPVLKQRINIEAKTDLTASVRDMQQMLQPLLAERFKLAVHREKREMNVLLMDLANRDGRLGPKIKKSDIACDTATAGANRLLFIAANATGEQTRCGVLPAEGPGRIIARGIDMPMLAAELAPSQRRPVIDRTGLTGRYDIDLTYTPEVFAAATLAQRGATAPPGVDPNGPPLFVALRDQLGIKVESGRAPVEVVVIDRIEPLIED